MTTTPNTITNPVDAHQFDTLNPFYNRGRAWARSEARPDQLRRLIQLDDAEVDVYVPFDAMNESVVRIMIDHDPDEPLDTSDYHDWAGHHFDLEPGEVIDEDDLAAFMRGVRKVYEDNQEQEPAIDDSLRDKVEAEVREEVDENFRDRLNDFIAGRGADDELFAGLDPDKAGDLAQAERRAEPIMEAQIASIVERRFEAAVAKLIQGVAGVG